MTPLALYSKFVSYLTMPYYAIRNTYPIWYGILNKEARKKFEQYPPILTDVQKKIVFDLDHDGIAISSLDELFPNLSPLTQLQDAASHLRTHAEINRKKTYLQQLFETFPVLDLQDPFMKLALQSDIFDILNSYMKMWTKFEYLNLNITIPVASGTEPRQSQCWHRDPGDKKIIKMFVYLNNVDETAGPFIYVLKSQYGGKWRHLFPQRLPNGVYPNAKKLETQIPNTEIKVCTAKAGTVIFADTTGLHKGGYATANERIMFTAGYTTSASPRGIYYRHPEQINELLKQLPKKIQFAISGKHFGDGLGY